MAARLLVRWPALAPAVLSLGLLAQAPSAVSAQEEPVVVYLVRHAERADDDGPVDPVLAADPPLSESGERRARDLVGALASVDFTHIHSTDYRRTRSTAAPISEALALPIASYDAGDLTAFARQLRATPGVHLVVGHSNTTPELVDILGGDAGAPIEEREYDRVYVVYILPGGAAGSALFRYGASYRGGP